RGADRRAPAIDHRLREDLGDQRTERRHHSAVGDVAIELLELARRHVTALGCDSLVDLAYQRRLADPRVARDQDGLDRTARYPRERIEQGADLGVAPVQPVRELEPSRDVVLADGERRDPPELAELAPAALEVGDQTTGGLIALIGRLR